MKAEVFGFATRRKVKGRRKIALESGVIIGLVNKPEKLEILDDIIKEISPYLYTHRRCIGEAKKVLVRDYKFKSDDANKQVDDFIEKYKIKTVLVLKENAKYAIKILKDCNDNSIDLHTPDNFILADFKKFGIEQIYSQDDTFMESSEFLGIPCGRLIDKESDDLDKIRKFFKKYKVKK